MRLTKLGSVKLSQLSQQLASMLRLLNIRIFSSQSGTSADKTKSDLYGGITSRTPRASFLLLIAMIVIVLLKLGRSCSAC